MGFELGVGFDVRKGQPGISKSFDYKIGVCVFSEVRFLIKNVQEIYQNVLVNRFTDSYQYPTIGWTELKVSTICNTY